MDTPIALISFICGIVSLFITIAALVVSINIYNATAEYEGIKKSRLKKSIKVYLRRIDPKETKLKKLKKNFRIWWVSYWLIIFPSKIKHSIEKRQRIESKRKDKNKKYSEKLVLYGFGGVIAFARNEENDDLDDCLYKTAYEYLYKKEYEKLVSLIKTNFVVHETKSTLR